MTVTRLVLDSNCARSLLAPQFVALKERGFVISLSITTFEEVWANSSRKEKYGVLYAPAARLAQVIDTDRPLLSTGRHLREELEAVSLAQRRRRREAFNAKSRLLWSKLVAGKISEETWRTGGGLANEQIDDLANNWTDTRRQALTKEYPAGIMALSDEDLFRRLKPLYAKHDHVPSRLAERWDAYFSAVTLIAVRDAKKALNQPAPDENDAEDLQLLLQLAQPAFLLTKDSRLISLVDDSKTYQGPWVRTFGELITDPLPSGVPWGKSAREQARLFRRRPRKERNALDEEVRNRYLRVEASGDRSGT
jgi:hypothetical protein